MNPKCGSFAQFFVPSLFVLLVGFCSFLSSDTSHAVSDYDTAIVHAVDGDFKIGSRRSGTEYTQDTINSSTNWYNPTYYKTAWNYTSYGAKPAIDSFLSTFNSHVSDGKGYAVTAYHNSNHSSDYQDTLALWVFDENLSICMDTTTSWAHGYLKACDGSSAFTQLEFTLNGDQGGRLQTTAIYGTQTSTFIPTAGITQGSQVFDANQKMWILGSDTVSYPTGYAGFDPTKPPVHKPVVRPDFTYQVVDKKITAHDYNQDLPTFTPEAGYTVQGYSVEWSLYKCGGAWDDVAKSCSGGTLVDHQIKLQDQDYEFTVSDYADYYIVAQYLVQQCYRYPSYPSTPDYCFYVDLGTVLPDYVFNSTTIHMKLDGSSYTGDTTHYVCDSYGYCEAPVVDCSSQPDFIQKLTCDLNKQLKFGVLNPSINAFKSLFTSFTVPPNPTCSIAISNVIIAPGKTFPLASYSSDACNSAAQLRSAFPIAPILLNALFGLFTVMLIIGTFNKLTDHRDNDLIQGI